MSVRMPAEWTEQEWIWIGFPHRADLWEDSTALAQEQIAAFANAVAETGQRVRLVVHDAANEARAARRRYEAKFAEYEATIRQARAESYRRSEQERAAALDERRRLIEEAKQHANEEIGRAKQEIERQIAVARGALESESRQIAERISRTVLGRTVGGGAD